MVEEVGNNSNVREICIENSLKGSMNHTELNYI